ncbi:MAG: hypothetical protein M1817_004841 [Caeruleum heppii]|nr:MAG: hypothetical protein M1817_004841 [Caeruleum heppii]
MEHFSKRRRISKGTTQPARSVLVELRSSAQEMRFSDESVDDEDAIPDEATSLLASNPELELRRRAPSGPALQEKRNGQHAGHAQRHRLRPRDSLPAIEGVAVIQEVTTEIIPAIANIIENANGQTETILTLAATAPPLNGPSGPTSLPHTNQLYGSIVNPGPSPIAPGSSNDSPRETSAAPPVSDSGDAAAPSTQSGTTPPSSTSPPSGPDSGSGSSSDDTDPSESEASDSSPSASLTSGAATGAPNPTLASDAGSTNTSSIAPLNSAIDSALASLGASLLPLNTTSTSGSSATLSSGVSSGSTTSGSLPVTSTTSGQSGVTQLSSSVTSSSAGPSVTTSPTVSSDPSGTSEVAGSPTGVGGGAGGGNGGDGSGSPSAGAGNGSSSDTDSTPPTPVLVGGVVGGLAGLALILVIILFLIRRRKQKQKARRAVGGGPSDQSPSAAGLPAEEAPASSGAMAQRSSETPSVAAGFFRRFRPASQQTASTEATATSERGFYRVSGRKLPPVLAGGGGDGYGGGYDSQTLSDTSFYRDSRGLYGGPGVPAVTSTAAGPSSPGLAISTDNEGAVMRPSPARTPVTSPGPQARLSTPPMRRPRPAGADGIGRSHPSHDGSRGSRFTEDVV